MSLRLTYLKSKGYVLDDGSIRHTKVTQFCLPMFDLHYNWFDGALINAHIQENVETCLYIIFLAKRIKDEKVQALIGNLASNKNLVDYYLDDDNAELVYKLRIPEQYLDDYDKIIDGQYSKISLPYKTKLTSRYYYDNTVYDLKQPPLIINGQVATTMFEILNPSPKKREIIAKHFGVEVSSIVEFISKPNLRYELYKRPSELFNEEQYIL